MQDEGSFEMGGRRHNEDIERFMNRLQFRMWKDHGDRSPLCRAVKTEYVKIPAPEDRPIGSSPQDAN